jgi:hypothetical protein
MLAKVVVVGVHRIVARGAQYITSNKIMHLHIPVSSNRRNVFAVASCRKVSYINDITLEPIFAFNLKEKVKMSL